MAAFCIKQESESVTIPCVDSKPDHSLNMVNPQVSNQPTMLPAYPTQHQDGTAVVTIDLSKQRSSPAKPIPIPMLSPRKASSNIQQLGRLTSEQPDRDPRSGLATPKQVSTSPTASQQPQLRQSANACITLEGAQGVEKSSDASIQQPAGMQASHATTRCAPASIKQCNDATGSQEATAQLKAFAASLFKSGRLPLDSNQLRAMAADLLNDATTGAATSSWVPTLRAAVQAAALAKQPSASTQLQKLQQSTTPQAQCNQAKPISRSDEVTCRPRPAEEHFEQAAVPKQAMQAQQAEQNGLGPPLKLVPVGGHLVAQALPATSKPSASQQHHQALQLPTLASSSCVPIHQASLSPTAAGCVRTAAQTTQSKLSGADVTPAARPPLHAQQAAAAGAAQANGFHVPDAASLTQTQRLQLIARIMYSQNISPAQLAAAIAAKQGIQPATISANNAKRAEPTSQSHMSSQSQKPFTAHQASKAATPYPSDSCMGQQGRSAAASELSHLQAAMQAALKRQTNTDIPTNIAPDAAGVLTRALQQRISMLLQQQSAATTAHANDAGTNAAQGVVTSKRQSGTETPSSDTSVTSTLPATTTSMHKMDVPVAPPPTTAVTRTLPISKAGSPARNTLPSHHSTTTDGSVLQGLAGYLQQQALKGAASQHANAAFLDRLQELSATGINRRKRSRDPPSDHAVKKRSATVVKPTFVSRKRHEQHAQAAMDPRIQPELPPMSGFQPSDQQVKAVDQEMHDAVLASDSRQGQGLEDDDMYMAACVMEQLRCGSMSTDDGDRSKPDSTLKARLSNDCTNVLNNPHTRLSDKRTNQCISQRPSEQLHIKQRASGVQEMAAETALKDCANSAGYVQKQRSQEQQQHKAAAPGKVSAAEEDDGSELMYQLLDRLRPLVVSLAKHGAPSPTQVWVAVQAMKQPELMKLSRAGLPYLEELYNYEEHHAECAQLLRIMLHLQPASPLPAC